MKLSLESDRHIYRIHAYEPQQVVIKNPLSSLPENFALMDDDEQWRQLHSVIRRSFILTPQRLQLDWAPTSLEDLNEGHLQPLLAEAAEVILLGTGGRLRFPAAGILAPVHRAGVGIEVMDSHAACRTFNILADEGRRVMLAAILP